MSFQFFSVDSPPLLAFPAMTSQWPGTWKSGVHAGTGTGRGTKKSQYFSCPQGAYALVASTGHACELRTYACLCQVSGCWQARCAEVFRKKEVIGTDEGGKRLYQEDGARIEPSKMGFKTINIDLRLYMSNDLIQMLRREGRDSQQKDQSG